MEIVDLKLLKSFKKIIPVVSYIDVYYPRIKVSKDFRIQFKNRGEVKQFLAVTGDLLDHFTQVEVSEQLMSIFNQLRSK